MLGTFPTSASMQDALETMPRGTHEKLTDTQSVFSSVAPSLPASDVTDGARGRSTAPSRTFARHFSHTHPTSFATIIERCNHKKHRVLGRAVSGVSDSYFQLRS